MALYWYGGTGNWSDYTNHWSNNSGNSPSSPASSAPTSTDDVIFDANSFSVNGSVVTLDATANCLSMDWTGIDQTVTFTSSVNIINIYGSLTLATNLSWSFSGTAYVYLKATTSRNITTNGVAPSFNRLYMDGVGGKWTLQDNMDCGIINPWYFVNGEFDTNNKNVTKTSAGDLSWQVLSGTKVLTLGSSVITLGNGVLFGTANDSGLTINSGTSTIKMDGDWFTGATKTYYNIEINTSSRLIGGSIGALTCNNLTRSSGANTLGNFPISTNLTVTGTLTLNGNNSTNYRLIIYSTSLGTARVITAANISCSNVDFRDITGAGTASWNLSSITGLSGDCGGNSGITFTTAVPQYWHVGTGSWSDSSKWFTATNGGGSAGRVPLPQDDVYFDASSFDGSGTITVNCPRIGRSLDMSGVSYAVTMTLSNAIECYGSYVLGSNITPGGNYAKTLIGIGSYNINTYNKSLYSYLNIYRGTYTALSNIELIGEVANQFAVYSGGFILNGYILKTILLNVLGTSSVDLGTGTVYAISGSSTWAGYISFASTSTLLAQNSTLILQTSSNPTNDNPRIIAPNKSLGTVILSGTTTKAQVITDTCSINELIIDAGKTVNFVAGKTYTITTFTAIGTAGNLITLDSTTTGTYNLTKVGGRAIYCDYLNIQHCIARPWSGAGGVDTWFAGDNSVNNQSVATAGNGWIFTSEIPSSTSNSVSSSASPSSSLSTSPSPSAPPETGTFQAMIVNGSPAYGYFAGGDTTTVVSMTDRIIFSSGITSLNTVSNLSQARSSMGSVSDGTTYGYFAGGYTGGLVSTIDIITFSTGVNAVNTVSSLSQAKNGLVGLSDGLNYGYFAGGYTGAKVSSIERIVFSASVNSLNTVSILSDSKDALGSVSDGLNYGYFAGGYDNVDVVFSTDRIVFSTGVVSLNTVSNLSEIRSYMGSVSDGAKYGYFAGGYTGDALSTTDRIVFSTGVTSLNTVSNLSSLRESFSGLSDGMSFGYFAGGNSSPTGLLLTADRIDFSTGTTNANTVSNLSEAKYGLAGLSDCTV